MIYGVQLFGCSKEFRQDPTGFFMRMKHAGIHQMEPCILFDDPIDFKLNAQARGDQTAALLPELLWLPIEVPAFAAELRSMGLTLSSAHAFVSSLSASREKLLETAKRSGITSYVLNVPDAAKQNPRAFCEELNQLAAALGSMGVELWLHNGGADTLARVEGVSLYRWILNHCKKLYAQPDTGWLLYGGEDPYSFLSSLQKKLKSIHFKDLVPDFSKQSGSDLFAVLGDGCVDVAKIMELVPRDGSVSVVIDQDMSRGDFFGDLEQSAALLRSIRP